MDTGARSSVGGFESDFLLLFRDSTRLKYGRSNVSALKNLLSVMKCPFGSMLCGGQNGERGEESGFAYSVG